MVFGQIQYLNLLPFEIFMKRYIKSSQEKMSIAHTKGVPSKINTLFHRRKIDAAFISSASAKNYKHLRLGIIAKKEVLSVLLIPSHTSTPDKASASSNLLAKVLGLQGEVIIGDRALRYSLEKDDGIDLAKLWQEHYKLPFVFALLCFHKNEKRYKKIERLFLKQRVKIPFYLLQNASKESGIEKKAILAYLELISYELTHPSKKGLKLFYKKSKTI